MLVGSSQRPLAFRTTFPAATDESPSPHSPADAIKWMLRSYWLASGQVIGVNAAEPRTIDTVEQAEKGEKISEVSPAQ